MLINGLWSKLIKGKVTLRPMCFELNANVMQHRRTDMVMFSGYDFYMFSISV